MCMRSRLNYNENLPEQTRNPPILHPDSTLAKRIMLDRHVKLGHSGPELTNRNLRNDFWISGGRSKIRKVVKDCHSKLCKYPNLKQCQQQEPNLPTARLKQSNFNAISLDLCVPFTINKCGICKSDTK